MNVSREFLTVVFVKTPFATNGVVAFHEYIETFSFRLIECLHEGFLCTGEIFLELIDSEVFRAR